MQILTVVTLVTYLIGNVGTVEILPRLDASLPPAQAVEGGTFLPHPRDTEIARRLLHYYEMPGLCKVRLDEVANIYSKRLESLTLSLSADRDLARVQEMRKASPGSSALWFSVGAVAGVLLTYLIVAQTLPN